MNTWVSFSHFWKKMTISFSGLPIDFMRQAILKIYWNNNVLYCKQTWQKNWLSWLRNITLYQSGSWNILQKREKEIFLPSTPFVCQFAKLIFIWFDLMPCLNMKLGIFDLKKLTKWTFLFKIWGIPAWEKCFGNVLKKACHTNTPLTHHKTFWPHFGPYRSSYTKKQQEKHHSHCEVHLVCFTWFCSNFTWIPVAAIKRNKGNKNGVKLQKLFTNTKWSHAFKKCLQSKHKNKETRFF